MLKVKRKILYAVTILLLFHFAGTAQPNTPVLPSVTITETELPPGGAGLKENPNKPSNFIIADILVNGNRKTKPYIIERELTFKRGDTVLLADLIAKFEYARQQLMNTKLFNEVVVALKSFRGYLVDVEINVKERWYVFPIPYFKPVDRNLSAWADKNYSFERVNYGLKLYWDNVTGRNDKFKAWFITGYTHQFQFSYEQPYADKSLKHGYSISVSHASLKEVNTNTVENKQVFLKADSIDYAGKYLNQLSSLFVGYYYRPAIRTRHSLLFGLTMNKIDSAVLVANPKYFNNNKTKIFYPELTYRLEYTKIDYIPYPLKGFMGEIMLTKKGITSDMNLLQLTAKATRAWDLGWKSSYTLNAGGMLKLPFDQPYYNSRMFGYGDFYLRGLEKYVVDGVAGAIVRNTLRRELFKFNVNLSRRAGSHSNIPFRIFAKTYADAGYAYNKSFPENSLVNTMLYTAGAGFDVLTFYDFVFRFEYSVNQLGEKGIFFHVKNDF